MKLENLSTGIWADGAVLDDIAKFKQEPYIKGFTTNPSLLRKAGIHDYWTFMKKAVAIADGSPIAFEVLADDFPTMKKEAEKIATLGPNVYVKIPVTNTLGQSSASLIAELSAEKLNIIVTAVFSIAQIKPILPVLSPESHSIIAFFVGRLSETGTDPLPIMAEAEKIISQYKNVQLMWASVREVRNIFEADRLGIDLITVTSPVLNNFGLLGLSPEEASLASIKGLNRDVQTLGLNIL